MNKPELTVGAATLSVVYGPVNTGVLRRLAAIAPVTGKALYIEHGANLDIVLESLFPKIPHLRPPSAIVIPGLQLREAPIVVEALRHGIDVWLSVYATPVVGHKSAVARLHEYGIEPASYHVAWYPTVPVRA